MYDLGEIIEKIVNMPPCCLMGTHYIIIRYRLLWDVRQNRNHAEYLKWHMQSGTYCVNRNNVRCCLLPFESVLCLP